ncbi:MAG: hypothetical protein JNN30_06960 [Rhodanobacteraceae bacterium]|nr:hypothetical protein [Rhodanobacteraceae bacterium]
MSLLREIQSAAIDSGVPLTTLLRKCKVLAARLGNEKFKSWIDRELNGYESKDDLPEYRILNVNSKGHFSGPFQSGLRNADIPMTCMPEELRESLSHTYMMQPVAALEDLIARGDGGTLHEAWNPDIVAHFGQNIYQNMNCMQAWKVIPKGAVVAAVDTIRTRVLNFVLDVEAEAPEAGEAPLNSNPLSQDRVQHIFNTNIYGVVQNLANAGQGVQQNATYNAQNADLFQDLIRAIEASGAPADVVASIARPVDEMRQATNSISFREAYVRFISVASDHIQVIGAAIAPFMQQLAALLG